MRFTIFSILLFNCILAIPVSENQIRDAEKSASIKEICPVCHVDFESPADISVLLEKQRRICEHAYCKKCASEILYGKHRRDPPQCSYQCAKTPDSFLVVDINDSDKLFLLFDLDNDDRISWRDFEKGLKVLQLEQFASAEEAKNLFDNNAFTEQSSGKNYVHRQAFPKLWAPIAEQFKEWLSQTSSIHDSDVLTAPVPIESMDVMAAPIQQNPMNRNAPIFNRDFCCNPTFLRSNECMIASSAGCLAGWGLILTAAALTPYSYALLGSGLSVLVPSCAVLTGGCIRECYSRANAN
jgi:hypothetical protein